jgi:hypothetical protein
MLDWRKFYGGNYLSAKALGKRTLKGKILSVSPETIKGTDDETNTRLCVELEGEDKKIPLNAGNAEALAAKFGDDCGKWKGKKVIVDIHMTTYNGKPVPGLRIRPSA